jgi:hypothetical protein
MKIDGWEKLRRRKSLVLVVAVVAAVTAATVTGVSLFAVSNSGSATSGTGSTGRSPAIDSKTHAAQSVPDVATPSAAEITEKCQLTTTSTAAGPEAVLPSKPITMTISPSGGVWGMSESGSDLYVVNGNGVLVYSLSGSLLHTFSLPSQITHYGDNEISEPVVDPDGDIFVSSYYGQMVYEMSSSGTEVRTFDPNSGNPTNIFALKSSSGAWELGVSTVQDTSGSYVYTESGSRSGTVSMRVSGAGYTSPGADGQIIYTTGGGMVETWNSTATKMLSQFGTPGIAGANGYTGGPLTFYYADEAAYYNGVVYAADGPSKITSTQSSGLVIGTTNLNNALGYGLDVTGALAAADGNLYVQTGTPFANSSATISVIPVTTVTEFTDAPGNSANVLGWGAGLTTGQTGQYFRPGAAVAVHAKFASWWTSLASHLVLSYMVWDEPSILSGVAPKATTMRLPTTASGLSSVALSISSADKAIGPHEVEAWLYTTSGSKTTLVGSTCMPYTVGAAGDKLDFSTLPSGTGAGGAEDNRAVALNSQLGLTGVRNQSPLGWSNFLPHCNAANPTASTCGAGALDFSGASSVPFKAAYLAKKDNVKYWLQVSGGDSVSMALVTSGLWQQDIQALVAHYSKVPSGCGQCAAVTAWEPWNESNNTGWSNPAKYVSQVLEPFYKAVQAAAPGDTVLGGSTLEVVPSWWQGLISAGGLKYLTVAAVHPYPGNNDAWEEDGIETQLAQLKSMLGGKQIWISEVGWWSDGNYNYLHQADAVARAMIWQRLLDIPVWNYFIDEGDFDNPTDPTFSLIQSDDYSSTSDDYVKPAALSAMTESSLLSGRSSLGQATTGIPQAYAAGFGPAGGGDHDVTAIWTDGLSTDASITVTGSSGQSVPVTITTEYGATTNMNLTAGKAYALPIADQVTYVTYPTGHKLQISSPESYGTDLALSSAGATATASSGNASAALVNPSDDSGPGQGWQSSASDKAPTITVNLKAATTINRVLVDTQSLGSTASGLRNYSVAVKTSNGSWKTVDTVTDQFRYHIDLVAFSPVSATAVKITVTSVNFGGYAGGSLPSFCTTSGCVGTAFLHAVEIYAGTASPAAVKGDQLRKLP